MRELIFLASLVFVVAGGANYSHYSFWPAVPFLFLAMTIAFRWEGHFLGLFFIVLIATVSLFFLQRQHGRIVHPSLGRPFQTVKDLCLCRHKFEDEYAVVTISIGVKEAIGNDCQKTDPTAVETQLMQAGASLIVNKVNVQKINSDYVFVIHADTSMGLVDFYPDDFGFLRWGDGAPILQADLTRPVFTYASLLMQWPSRLHLKIGVPKTVSPAGQ